jgi:hypothetical protein
VFYFVAVSDEDHPAGGTFEDVAAALSYAEEVSGRVRAKVGRWDGAVVHVWEAVGRERGPQDKLIARFVDGKRINQG